MKLHQVSPNELTLSARNPRKHSEQNIEEIAQVLQRHGFLDPVAITKDYRVIFGNGRTLAAQRLGLKTIPCIVLPDNLSESDLREIAIAHNRLAERSEWDKPILGEELQELAELGIEIGDLGFSDAELSEILAETDQMSAEYLREMDDLDEDVPIFGEDVKDSQGENPTKADASEGADKEITRMCVFKIELEADNELHLRQVLAEIQKKYGMSEEQTFMCLVDSYITD